MAARLLDDWPATLNRIVKVMPHDYKRALAEQLAAEGEAEVAAAAAGPAATPGYARRRTDLRPLMGELGAFLRLERVGFDKRDPEERVRDYRQYFSLPDDRTLRDQGARCMDCGVPFCHEGCPLGNLIPDWNDLVYRDRWRDALTKLHATNNFPEFTGLICPAPCESACVLDINDDAVTIEQIELAIVTRGFEEGWIAPEPPESRTDRTVAVIGSGPAGPGGGGRAQQARPPRHGLRARRGAGRAAPLRRARRQAREVDHRPAREPARGGGRSSSATTSTWAAT